LTSGLVDGAADGETLGVERGDRRGPKHREREPDTGPAQRDVFLGVTRFDDFQERLGISRNILNQRLNHLVETGVLEKVSYSDHPPRYDCRLTDKGRDLWPVVTAMRQWGDRYAAPDGPPFQLTHEGCGHICDAIMVCSVCGEPIEAKDVRAEPGPGAVNDLIGASNS
jgi:DNA-binding HxlR family transcriptional regulator